MKKESKTIAYTDAPLDIGVTEKEVIEIKKLLEKNLFIRQENMVHHNSFEIREQCMEFISSGDKEGFMKWINSAFSFTPGTLADSQLRNQKNQMICFCAILVDHLLDKKLLDSEIGYSISDVAIQMIEASSTSKETKQVAIATALELMEQCNEKKKEPNHQLVKKAKQYIFNHMHEKISISDMAVEIGTSQSYLSQVFRKYKECTIKEYIYGEKIYRAQNLLKYSDFSIQDISEYLGFSSCSKFSLLFKKQNKITPREYRYKYKTAMEEYQKGII